MQIKNIIVSLIAISLLPVCCERLRNDSRLDENVDSTCDADSSLTECEMLSDTTAFVGNGNTLLCRLPSIIKEAKVQGRNLNILEKNYSPRVYKGKFSFSSSYPRVIWSGEDFTVYKFASIDLDKELITFNAK